VGPADWQSSCLCACACSDSLEEHWGETKMSQPDLSAGIHGLVGGSTHRDSLSKSRFHCHHARDA
jgi:hypothetical protein